MFKARGRTILLALILFLSIGLVSCGSGGGGGGVVAVSDNSVARVEVTPKAVLLSGAGESETLSVTAYNAAGQLVSTSSAAALSSLTWTSNKPADVSIDADGILTSHASLGSAQIVAEVDGVSSAPVLVTVAQPAAGAVLVDDTQVVGNIQPADPFVSDNK